QTMKPLSISAFVMLFLALLTWSISRWGLSHPIWSPAEAAFSFRPNSSCAVPFRINTLGTYRVRVRCDKQALPKELTAHFDDWRVPGDVPCDLTMELLAGQSKVFTTNVHNLVPSSSTGGHVYYSISDVELQHFDEFLLTLVCRPGLPTFESASPVVQIQLPAGRLSEHVWRASIGYTI